MHTSPRWKTPLVVACLASTLTAAATPYVWAADGPTADPAAAAAPSSKPQDASTPKLLPEVNVKDIPLPDLIDYLRDVDPSFQAVVAYDPGANAGEPKIQELRLKNVSAESVLKLLSQTYPRISLQEVPPEKGANTKIWTVRVEADPNNPFARGGGGAAGAAGGFVPGIEMAGGIGPEGQPAGATVVTAVHRLREIVDDLAPPNGGAAERKTALESVLSLVQAALETGGGGGAKRQKAAGVELKLHEATETLIFHGPLEQSGIVAQALETLAPRRAGERGGERDRFVGSGVNTQLRQLGNDIERLRRQIAALEQQAPAAKADPGALGTPPPGEPRTPPGAPTPPPPSVDPNAAPRPGVERK
jgi:hypothetical protein